MNFGLLLDVMSVLFPQILVLMSFGFRNPITKYLRLSFLTFYSLAFEVKINF